MSHTAQFPPYESTVTSGTILQELESFGIPFICYGDKAQVTRVSSAARELLAGAVAGNKIVAQIDRAVAIELDRPLVRAGPERFPVTRVLPLLGMGGTVAIRRPISPDRSVRALVVLRFSNVPEPRGIPNGLTVRELQVARLIASGEATSRLLCASVSARTRSGITRRMCSRS